MTRTQRHIHVWVWLVLGPVVGTLFVLGLWWRPGTPVQPGPVPGVQAPVEGEAGP